MNQGRPAYLEKQLGKRSRRESWKLIHRSVFGQDDPHATDRVLAKTEGKGRMEVYSVYPGIDVSYTAFLSAEATFHHAASPAIVELFYCHSGRVGWNMREGTAVYLGAGDLTVHSAACCADSAMMFPLGYAEGIAISIRLASALRTMNPPSCGEVGREREKIGKASLCCGKPVILSSCPDLERIFAPLYAASPARRSLYLPLKIQELLLFLLDFQPEQNALAQYCSQQTEQIKRVHQQLTDHLDQRFTIGSALQAVSDEYRHAQESVQGGLWSANRHIHEGIPHSSGHEAAQGNRRPHRRDRISGRVWYAREVFPKHSRTLRRCCPRPIGKRTFPPTGLPRPGPRDWLMGQQGPVSERRGQVAGHRPRFLLPPFFPGMVLPARRSPPARPAVFCHCRGAVSLETAPQAADKVRGAGGSGPWPGVWGRAPKPYAAAFLAETLRAPERRKKRGSVSPKSGVFQLVWGCFSRNSPLFRALRLCPGPDFDLLRG